MAEDPSFGINAETGSSIAGWPHVVQSLRDVFLTNFGRRLMREWYGSLVPQALGRNINRAEMLPVVASITSAVEQWEPRFLVHDVVIDGEGARSGALKIELRGRFRPRALLGDMTESGDRSLSVVVTGDALVVR